MENYLYQIYNCFSYWVYIWFVLYYFKLINISPIIVFILFLFLLTDLINYITNNKFTNVVLVRIYIIILIHHIPLIYLINDLRNKTKKEKDIILKKILFYLVLIGIIYIIYLGIHNTQPYKYYCNFVDNIPENIIDYIKLRFINEIIFILFMIFISYVSYKIINKII